MKIAIYGYGNIGKGVECAIAQNSDAELFGIFTRRAPESLVTLTGAKVYPAADIDKYAEEIDALIICAGSATDLPEMTPALAEKFNVVDSFDTHARIPEHFEAVNAAAEKAPEAAEEKLLQYPELFNAPIVRNGKEATVGYCPEIWSKWE